MVRTSRLVLALGASLLAAPGLAADAPPPVLRAEVVGADGKPLGTVSVQQTPAGVLVTTDLKGLPEGDHGFHFHEKGLCDAAGKFASAGGHFTAGDPVHGLMSMGGPHGGDMPNQHVGPDGMLKVQVLNTGVTIAPGSKSIVDADGTALVIHANADDYTSQPAGNAGGRIACAVLSAPK
ncbi:superoxide dismutase family protein [Novosphingobium sp. KA1]|uniref:superoxide dismutase family protein n=1 Tax=Novosphingobium sp. (strain KA1) TaxID=164608 RepID=UPI001A8C4A14|nr:superoxide dismutase family protein [Novosphingobium sp. KA1]QSR15681.1 CRISPR-associated protein Csn1 [Novosphingobium sp. KA1]